MNKKNLAVNHAPGCVMTTPSQLANRSLLTSRHQHPNTTPFSEFYFFSSETRNSFRSLNVSPNISFQHWLISQTCRNGVPAKTTWRFWVRNILASSTDRFIQGLSIFLPPFAAHQFQALSFRINLTPANFLADIFVSTKTIKLCCLSISV